MQKSSLRALCVFALAALCMTISLAVSSPAFAQVAPAAEDPTAPVDPHPAVAASEPIVAPVAPAGSGTETLAQPQTQGPDGPQGTPGPDDVAPGDASISLNLNDALNKPSQSITIILLITVLSVAPALLMMMTSFTRIIIVLTLTRNALGVTNIPPNQVVVGLALFLSLFIMSPVLSEMNDKGVQPYLRGEITQQAAFDAGSQPLREFMLKHVRDDELALFVNAQSGERPANADDVAMTALIPAFILSELKTAFIIGFVIFIPFLVIDIIVSSALMAMGMMMLPPQMISLPFKLMLFVLVDGWALVVRSLLTSFS